MKTALVVMFITGILLWDIIDSPWEYFRVIQTSHIIGSGIIILLFILPFVLKHLYKHILVDKMRSLHSWILVFVLFMIILSGLYLFLFGNRGGDIIGISAFYIHLYGSFAVVFLLFYHIKQTKKVHSFILLLLMSTDYYSLLQADIGSLTQLKIEKDISKYHNTDWTSSATCKSCHSDIFDQWADSNHKNLVDSNPYYMV
jgi:hypothetical protein